jgi:DNA-binding XRE family transcriptional regulator
MTRKHKKTLELIKKNTVSLEDAFRDFTPEQNKIVEAEIRYYEVLVELRKMRKKLGLTQEQLAMRADVPRTTITKIESGSFNPTINTLMSLASAMDKRLQVRFL